MCSVKNQDAVVKLAVSTLDYSRDGLARVILSKILTAATDVRVIICKDTAIHTLYLSTTTAFAVNKIIAAMFLLFSSGIDMQTVCYQTSSCATASWCRVF